MAFQRNEDIIIEKFDKQVLLFDPDNNLPYVLNRVASYILLNLDEYQDNDKIAGRVCQEFDVEFQQALSDVKVIMDEFIQKKIVKWMD